MIEPQMLAWALVWLGAVGGFALVARPSSFAVVASRLDQAVGRVPPSHPGPVSAVRARLDEIAERLGGSVRSLLRRPANAGLDRRLGRALVVAAIATPFDIRLAAIAGLLRWMQPVRAERRTVKDRHAAVLQELPEVVDLLSVAVRGGLTVPLAVAAVGERLDGEVAGALRVCVEEASLGQHLSDRLELVPSQLGDATRPLVRALVAADRYGVPIGDPLERVAADVRTARRRSAEIAARRVPIKLLFPLVFCVLPSFALLTVAPVLASSLESLRL